MAKRLAPPTIIKLHVEDLVKSHGKRVPITLERYKPVEKEDGTVDAKLMKGRAGDENRPPRWFEVGLKAEKSIGYGRCGVVFTASLDYVWEYSNPDADPDTSPGPEYLPPVVMKIANDDDGSLESLADEALNYIQLRSLQGVAVPRCYGWFKGKLEDDMYIPGVHSNGSEAPREVSVLLLERMGDPLTMAETEEDKEDMRDIFIDIARTGVQQLDIRKDNIFQAPTPSPAHPDTTCRVHKRQHKYRLIDFESAQRHQKNTVMVATNYFTRLRHLYAPFEESSNDWDSEEEDSYSD